MQKLRVPIANRRFHNLKRDIGVLAHAYDSEYEKPVKSIRLYRDTSSMGGTPMSRLRVVKPLQNRSLRSFLARVRAKFAAYSELTGYKPVPRMAHDRARRSSMDSPRGYKSAR